MECQRITGLLAAALTVVASPTSAAPPGPSPRPIVLPWTFAPEVDGVDATVTHAAGLGFLDGFELGLGVDTRLQGDAADASVMGALAFRLGPIAFGLSIAGVGDGPDTKTTTTRLDWALAVRFSDAFALGLQSMDLGSDVDPLLDDYGALTLSASWRPARALGLSLALEHLDTPISPATAREEDPVLRLGVALRPGTERLVLGLEGARTLGDEVTTTEGMFTTRMMLLPGLALGAYVRYQHVQSSPGLDAALDGDHLQGGAFLGLYQGGAGLEAGFDAQDADGNPMGLAIFARVGTEKRASLFHTTRQVIQLKLSGPLPERPSRTLFGEQRPGFAHWLMALDLMKDDPDVAGLLLQIDAAPSWAQCWELRQAIGRLQKAGKKVVAIQTVGDMKSEYLAAAADESHLVAAGGLMLTGLSITQTYYLGLMEKLGVRAEFVKFDEYKSAPEPFSRTGPSDPAKEQIQAIIDGMTREWLGAVGSGRKLDEATLRRVLDEGPQSMHVATKEKLVDGLVETDAFGELVRAAFGPDARLVARYAPRPEGFRRWGGKDQIAILPVTGAIVDGGSAGENPLPIPFLGGETTGDVSFAAALARAVADDDVVAIVVRVDSGGGSAVASDKMYRALKSAQKKKPVVVSFGDIAASGGYYLAAGAPIFASPVTITGSIGIFSGKVELDGLYALLGLTTFTTKSNERADMMGPYRPFTEAEKAHARDTLRAYYHRFLGVVAEGRKMSVEDVDKIARGRVWLGGDALERKLVDVRGGLWDAIAEAKARAGLDPDDDVGLRYVGTLGALSSLQRLVAGVFGMDAALGDEVEGAPELPLAKLGSDMPALGGVVNALSGGGPLAMMPYTLKVD